MPYYVLQSTCYDATVLRMLAVLLHFENEFLNVSHELYAPRRSGKSTLSSTIVKLRTSTFVYNFDFLFVLFYVDNLLRYQCFQKVCDDADLFYSHPNFFLATYF